MTIPSAGEVVDERFRLEQEIGAGGFATVFAAKDLETNERVAIKFLRLDKWAANDDSVLRFERELRILQQLQSRYTVRLIGYGKTASDVPYGVFEYLDGVNLAELLGERGRLESDEVRGVLGQLLEALDEAHSRGVLHRDLKPENIVVVGRAPLDTRLIDFGIARPMEALGPEITNTGEVIGTVRYMSPEQLTAKPLTPASDIYSLGMVAVEMLLGRDGLQGGALHDQMERLRSGHVFSVPELERIDPVLWTVIGRMTARRPENRFHSASDVLVALEPPKGRRTGGVVVLTAAFAVLLALVVVTIVSTWQEAQQANTDATTAAAEIPPSITATNEVSAVDPNDAGARARPDVGKPNDGGRRKRDGSSVLGCVTLPHGDFHGLDAQHRALVHAAPELVAPDVRGVLILLADGSGIAPRVHLEKMGLSSMAEQHQLVVIVPQTKVADQGDSWDDANTAAIALRVSLLLEEWCIPDDVPVFLVGEGVGAMGVDRWLCLDVPDVRQPAAVVTTAHRYTRQEPRPCEGRTPRYLNLVQLQNKVEPVDGGQSCPPSEFVFYSAREQDGWWKKRYRCGRPPQRVKHEDGVCLHYECGYSRCDVDAGRDWRTGSRAPGDPSLPCVGVPGEFPYADVVGDFLTSR